MVWRRLNIQHNIILAVAVNNFHCAQLTNVCSELELIRVKIFSLGIWREFNKVRLQIGICSSYSRVFNLSNIWCQYVDLSLDNTKLGCWSKIILQLLAWYYNLLINNFSSNAERAKVWSKILISANLYPILHYTELKQLMIEHFSIFYSTKYEKELLIEFVVI